jgi:hypothetical protein
LDRTASENAPIETGEEMMDFSTHPLVETAWLEAHLSDDDLCIVDARWRGDEGGTALAASLASLSCQKSPKFSGCTT